MSQLSTTVSKPSTKKSGPKSTNPLEGFDEKLIARVKQIQAALGSNAPSVDIIVLHLNENKNNIDRTVLSILESVQNHTEWIGQQRPPKKLKNLPPAPSQGKSERHHTAVPNWERNRSKANEPPGASNRQGNFTEKSSARNEGGNRPQGQNKRVEGSRWGSGLEKKSASERTQEKDPVNKIPNSTSEDASLDKNINMAVPEPIQEKEESGKEEPCPPSKKSAGQHAAAVITVYAPMKKVGEVSVDQKPTTFLDALKKGTPAATTTSAVVARPSKVSPPNVPQKERTAKPTTVSSKPHAPRNTKKGGNRKAGRGHTAAAASHHDTSSTTQDHHREPKTHPETSADSDVGKRSEDCVTEVQKQVTPPKERHSDPSVNHQTPVMETTITSDPNLNPVVNPTIQARSRAVVTKKAMTGVEGPIAVSGSSDGNRFCHEEAHHSNPIVDSVPNASTRFIALRIRSDLEIFSSSLNANDSSRMLRAQPTLAVVSGASRVSAQQYAVDPNLHSSNRTNQGEKHMKIQHENILPQPGVHTKDSNYPHRINKVQYHGPSNEHMADSRGISFLANAVNHAFSNQQNGTSLWNFTSGGRAPPVPDRHTQCPTPEVVESIRHVPHDNGDAEASMPYREGMHHPMPESMTGLMPQVLMYNHSVVPHERSDTPTSAHEGSQFSTSSSNTRNVNISSGYENDPWGMQLNPQYHSGPGRYHLPGSNLNSSMMNGNNFLGQQNAPSQNQLPFRTQPTNPNYGNRNTNYHHTQQHSLHSSVNNFAGSRHGVAPGNAGNQNYYNSGYHHMNTGSRNASVHGQPSTISSHGIPPHSLNHINGGTTSVKPVVHQVSVADNAQHAFGNMGTSSNNSNNHMVGKGPVSKGPNGSSMNERNAQSAAHYYSFGDISHGIGNQAPLSSATGGAASNENARSMTSWNSYIAGSAAGTNHEDAAHPKNSLPDYASATPMFPYGFNNTSSPNTNSMSASGSKRQPNAPPAPFTNPFTSTNVGNNTMAHNTGSSNDSNAKTRGVMGTNENGGHGAALNHPNRSQSRGNNNNSNVQSRGKQGTASNHHASALSSSYSVTGDAARHLSESEWNMN